MAAESPAQAATPRSDSAFESGPIVRRQLLHRSSRLEIQPLAAFTMNDSFIRNTLFGANVNYHLNNVFALGFTGAYGALHSDTSLRRNVEAELQAQRPGHLNSLSYAQIDWAADIGLSYVPIFGKFSIMNRMITHYDFHFMGGLAIIGESGVSASGTGEIDAVQEGVRAGGMLGLGMRLFLTDMISLNYDVRSYIYQRAEVSRGQASPQLGPTMVMSLGVAIFLPGAVKISR
ncbi:MAG: outer membrane beta-barrel domain-containing protein [Bradymonadaceae bacterium]